jgi:hypothetical protein
MQVRFLMLPGEIHGLQRPASQSRFNRKQNGSVTISRIPFGPLKVRSGRRLFQRIHLINWPVFCLPSLRAPSAARHVVLQRPIQRGPVAPVCPPETMVIGEPERWRAGVLRSLHSSRLTGLPGNASASNDRRTSIRPPVKENHGFSN